jgi:CSLREA domain-containing protein
MNARALIILFVSFLLFTSAGSDTYAGGNTLTVTKTADTSDGVCDSDCSLREAITAASMSGDTIVFSHLFDSPQTITLQLGQIEFAKDLSITGPGRDLLSISGNNAGRIFLIEGAVTVELKQMTLRDGRLTSSTDNAGAAILYRTGELNLIDVVVTNNFAVTPPPDSVGYGAVACARCTLDVVNSLFSNNNGVTTAGIHSDRANVNISNSSFQSNSGTAFQAGFMDVVTIESSNFQNNTQTTLAFGDFD